VWRKASHSQCTRRRLDGSRRAVGALPNKELRQALRTGEASQRGAT
jgi:hypothetical protein